MSYLLPSRYSSDAFCFPADVPPEDVMVSLFTERKELVLAHARMLGSHVRRVHIDHQLYFELEGERENENIRFTTTSSGYSTSVGSLYSDGRFVLWGYHSRGDWQRGKMVRLMPWLDWGWHSASVVWYPRGFWGAPEADRPEKARATTCLPLGMTGILDRVVRAHGYRPPVMFTVERNADGFVEFKPHRSPAHATGHDDRPLPEAPLSAWTVGPRRFTDRWSPTSNNIYLGNLVNGDACAAFANFMEVSHGHHLVPLRQADPDVDPPQQ